MMRNFAYLLLLAPLLPGCGASHHNDAKDPEVHKVFTHGDPLQLVSGVAANDSIFATGQLGDYDGYNLFGMDLYQQRTEEAPKAPATTASLESENAAGTKDRRLAKPPTYHFVEKDGLWYYQPSSGRDLKLAFAAADGKLALKSLNGYEVKPLYYSRKDNDDAFSLMFAADDEVAGHILFALYFVKQHTGVVPLADVSSDFHYLLGPGIVTKWQGPVELSLCGPLKSGEEDLIRSSVGAWSRNDHIGTSSFTVKRLEQTVAFSDVNTNCLMMVDDFLFEDDETSAVLGITSSIIDTARQQILSSRILIPRRAYAKLFGATEPNSTTDWRLQEQKARTLTHEFGHFLGLDHEFVRNADKTYKFPSIMSYNPAVLRITAHDREAIANLYGKAPQ